MSIDWHRELGGRHYRQTADSRQQTAAGEHDGRQAHARTLERVEGPREGLHVARQLVDTALGLEQVQPVYRAAVRRAEMGALLPAPAAPMDRLTIYPICPTS